MYDILMRRMHRIIRQVLSTAALCAAVLFSAGASAATIEHQRALFQSVFEAAERGDWRPVEQLAPADYDALSDYVLWPDLRQAYLRANIRSGDAAGIEQFLQAYGALKPGRDLRYRYALELVRRGDLQSYYRIYQAFYQGRKIAKLDCLALQAEIASGHGQRITARARQLWLVGRSQVDECDPVFEYLKTRQLLTELDYRKRYELAIDAGHFGLARWLARSIGEGEVARAEQWLAAQSSPEEFLARQTGHNTAADTPAQLAYAAERLTYRDPARAHQLWSAALKRHGFTDDQKHATARHIALWTARKDLPGAHERLAELAPAAVNTEVRRWRARTNLRRQDWREVLADIDGMPVDEQKAGEWRYWRATALEQTGQHARAGADLTSLAKERSYYGFLAADSINQAYAFSHDDLAANEAVITSLAASPALLRARELFLVGLESRGRSEWESAVESLGEEQTRQAAILAHRWGWHSRAIATAASVGAYDDLVLRYPLPYQASFQQLATEARISPVWAYGIARSESLFMRDIRSSAGAIGLMQLMPATGRDVARQIKLPYSGLNTLTDPVANIQLGTVYLGKMAERFGGNRILATAAYNAGPQRVKQWIPADDSLDARIWIENIPYNETRNYVRRVLAAETIFYWRLTGDSRRLSDELVAVGPLQAAERVASVSR